MNESSIIRWLSLVLGSQCRAVGLQSGWPSALAAHLGRWGVGQHRVLGSSVLWTHWVGLGRRKVRERWDANPICIGVPAQLIDGDNIINNLFKLA